MVNSLPEVYQGQDFVNFRQDVMKSTEYKTAATGYFDNPANMSGTELSEWLGTDTGNPTEVWLTRLRMTNTEIANYMAGRTVDWEDRLFALRFDRIIQSAYRARKTKCLITLLLIM